MEELSADNGHRRGHRSRSDEEPLPPPKRLDAEVRDLVVRALSVRECYRSDYVLGLEASGGSGLVTAAGHSVGHSNATEAAWASPVQRQRRAACRRAAKLVRVAAAAIAEAEGVLADRAEQPTAVSGDSVIDQGTFNRSVHRRRERELRSDA